MTRNLVLSSGVGLSRVTSFNNLISKITNQTLSGNTFLQSTLALSAPEIVSLGVFPDPPSGKMLIHDYQSVERQVFLNLDSVVRAQLDVSNKSTTTELQLDISDGPILRTAVREVLFSEVLSAKPLVLRAGVLEHSSETMLCSQNDVDQYLAASGDTNPIHRPGPQLRDVGLKAPIVPGLLLVSLIQPLVENRFGKRTINLLRARFAAPMLVGQPFAIGTQDRGKDRLRCFIHSEEKAHAVVDLGFSH